MNDSYYLSILNKYINYTYLEKNINDIDPNTTRELESRFEIDYQISDIVKKLNSLQIFNIEEENTVVEYHERNFRIVLPEIEYDKVFNKDELTNGEYKNQISSTKINLQGYIVNFAFSHELSSKIIRVKNPKVRRRNRYIIRNFLSDKYELHLTSSFDPFINKQKNLIEIEYNLNKIKDINDLISPIKYIFDLMYVKSTELLFPDNILSVIDHFNDYLRKMKKNLNKRDFDNLREKKLINYEDNINDLKYYYIKWF